MTGHNNPRALIVDDEHVIADTLTMILSRSGFDARAAYSGEMAVGIARIFQPHILVTDVNMPGINGVETAIRLREMLPQCKVLLFSGQSGAAQLIEDARAQNHVFELLGKPLHPADLLARLRSVMAAD